MDLSSVKIMHSWHLCICQQPHKQKFGRKDPQWYLWMKPLMWALILSKQETFLEVLGYTKHLPVETVLRNPLFYPCGARCGNRRRTRCKIKCKNSKHESPWLLQYFIFRCVSRCGNRHLLENVFFVKHQSFLLLCESVEVGTAWKCYIPLRNLATGLIVFFSFIFVAVIPSSI